MSNRVPPAISPEWWGSHGVWMEPEEKVSLARFFLAHFVPFWIDQETYSMFTEEEQEKYPFPKILKEPVNSYIKYDLILISP